MAKRPRATILKLEEGDKIVAKLLYADYQEKNDQVRIKAVVEGADRYIYLPLGAALAAREAGFLAEPTTDNWEVAKQELVTILKEEIDGKSRHTFAWVDTNGMADSAPASSSSGAVAAPATPVVPGVKGHPLGCMCADCADERRIAVEQAKAKAGEQAAESVKVCHQQWLDLDRAYRASLLMATYHQCRLTGVDEPERVELVAAQAGAATVLIHFQKTAMMPPTKAIVQELGQRLAKQLDLRGSAPDPEPAPIESEQVDTPSGPIPTPTDEMAAVGAPEFPDDEDDDLPF